MYDGNYGWWGTPGWFYRVYLNFCLGRLVRVDVWHFGYPLYIQNQPGGIKVLKGGAYGAKGGSVAYNEWWGTPVGFIEYIRYLCLGPPEPFSAHSACFPRVFRVFPRVFRVFRDYGKGRGKRGKRAENARILPLGACGTRENCRF